MASYIKSKVQQSLSFLLVLVIAFSVFSGVLFLNPSSSYAFDEATLSQALTGDKNLFGANLRRAYLSGADLRGAYLSGADLRGADLSGADLRRAYLSGADLRGADLRRADLSDADLSDADLSDADLSDARLIGANLSDARLIGAIADSETKFPEGFDAVGAGVDIRP